MRILQIGVGYPPFVGGAEKYTQVIAERSVHDGDDVTVICSNADHVEYYYNPNKPHIEAGTEIINGVQVIRCPVGHLPISPYSFYALRSFVTKIARAPKLSAPLLRWLTPLMPPMRGIPEALNRVGPDIDVVHGINISLEWPLIAGWRYARKHSIPFVTTPFVHVGDRRDQQVLRNYVMPHQLEVLHDADCVITQTRIEKQVLVDLGVSEDRVEVVGMGVDLGTLSNGNARRFLKQYGITTPVITFLGVITRDKGSFHLVQAVERLWAQGIECELVLAGPTVDEFERFYAQLKPETQSRIKRLGVVKGQAKQDLLAATDVFVLPSCIDSFGIVFLEAWAYGKPVIGGNAGGIPDVISHGEDGLLVDFGDVDGLAQAILRLLSDAELRDAMGRAGREKVEMRYTWGRIYNQINAIYQRVQG